MYGKKEKKIERVSLNKTEVIAIGLFFNKYATNARIMTCKELSPFA